MLLDCHLLLQNFNKQISCNKRPFLNIAHQTYNHQQQTTYNL